jgi:hypothetical protein
MLRSLWKRLGAIGFVLVVLACSSGGGCSSGCAGCGVTPLAGGFPKSGVIDNSAAARVTRHGLDFLGANLGTIAGKALGSNGPLTFPIGKSSSNFTVASATICDGPNSSQCVAQINIAGAKLALTAVHPDSLTISGTVPVRVQDIPVDVYIAGFKTCTIHVSVGNGGSCDANTAYVDVPVDVTLPFIAETIAPRDGYTKIDAANAQVNANISTGMVNFCGGLCASIAGALKSYIVGQITSPLQSQLKNALQSQLCTKTNPNVSPGCPTGTHDNGGTCYYDSQPSTCVPTELGTDGHVDLSGFLASISPGTAGGLDFVLAAGGNGIASIDPTTNTPDAQNGLTLALLGGALPVPQSGCVPPYDNKIPTGIPIPDELQSNTVAPWPQGDNGPDLGISLAGRYLNYAMGSVYNSGTLCLGVSTEQFAQLQSGLLSVLIPSIKRLSFEQKPAPVAITTRPQAPPTIKIGGGTDIKTDPLLLITLPQFSIDFYVWSMDRFVRAMTFTGDLSIPVNLSTAVDPQKNPNGGILPSLGDIGVANAKVTNSDLLVDDPTVIASGLGSLLGGIASQFLGSIKPIDLSSSLSSYGLAMTIPDGGIRKLTKGSDDYLAIFGDLGLASANAVQQADVQARILDKKVFPEAMTLATADRAKNPKLHVLFGSSLDNGSNAVEYSYAIDQGTHSQWSSARDFTIQNDSLFLQGKHTLNVWARLHGEELSQSAQPAQVPFTIDVLPPSLDLKVNDDGSLHVGAWDIVSAQSALRMRYRTTDSAGKAGNWTEWASVADVPASVLSGVASVAVEAQDEEGNVGSQSSDLIRGRPDPTLGAAGGGCGCTTVGSASSNHGLWGSLPLLGGLAWLFARRRRHAKKTTARRGETPRAPFADAPEMPRRGRIRTMSLVIGGFALAGAANPGCNCGSTANPNACGSDCLQTCDDPLPQGLIGAYTSVAVAKDGTIWVAGYNDSDGNKTLYGDLVAGKWDAAKGAVQWTSVDGVPAVPQGECPAATPTGWRGGVEDAGDDVGLWTSMVLDANGNPMVAYYDATHTQLKFVTYDGSKWGTPYVLSGKASTDQGRYVKMITVNNNPVVAFLALEAGTAGHTKSRVVVGRAQNPTPQSATDWKFEDAAVDDTGPCLPQFCTSGQACLTTTGGVTGVCTATVSGCQPACGTGQACISQNNASACVAVLDSSSYTPSYPNAFGDYVSLANGSNGLGLVVYDRFHGNLVGVSNAGGKWTATILDGQTGSGQTTVDTGDDGIAASLAITSNGDWHVTYVNGIQERLQYLLWPGGQGTPLAPEVIDDGYNNGAPYPDGQHIVGDDAAIQVDGSGNVTVAYQDSTAGVLRLATGAPSSGGAHKWTSKSVAQQGKFAGFFPRYISGTAQVANWWRSSDRSQQTESGDVTLVTP